MVRRMCSVKVKDGVLSKELRERLGIGDIILILQQNRLRWYGHVLRKDDTDWVKKCMEYAVEGSRRKGRPKRTWRGAQRLPSKEFEQGRCYGSWYMEEADKDWIMIRIREWVSVSSGNSSPSSPGQRAVK